MSAIAVLAFLGVVTQPASPPSPPSIERQGIRVTGVYPEPGATGYLGFVFETDWLPGQIVLRCPETLASSMGLHYIDHQRPDMPQLSALSGPVTWRSDAGRGTLTYRAETPEGVVFEGAAELSHDGAWTAFRVLNGTAQVLHHVSSQMCLDLGNAGNGLSDRHELARTFTWMGGERRTLASCTPTAAEKGRAPWLLAPTAAMREDYQGPMQMDDAWWVTDQTADFPLLARSTADDAGLTGIAWSDPAAMLMTNTNIPCLHAGPNSAPDIAPGKEAVWRGKVYLTRSGPEALLAQYKLDAAQGFLRHDMVAARAEAPGAALPSAKRLRVAGVRVVWDDGAEAPAAVVERGFALAEEAVAKGAELIVFPENWLHSEDPACQMVPEGRLVKRTEAFARAHGVYVCAGIVESWKFPWRDTYDTYLSAIIVGPGGFLSKHRKVDVVMAAYNRAWQPGMPKTDMGAWAGSDFAMHQAGQLDRLAVMICRDTNSSWAWTRVLTQNPEIIASPNLRDSVTKYGADFGAMAAASGVPVVVVSGHPASESFIVNRRGEVVAFLNDREGVIVADVELAPRDPSLRSFDVVHNTFVVLPEH